MSSAPENYRKETRIEPNIRLSADILSPSRGSRGAQEIVGTGFCRIENISKHGILVRSDTPLQRGQHLRVRLSIPDKPPLYLEGEARWNQQEGDRHNSGLYLLEARNSDYLLWQNYIKFTELAQIAPA